MSPQSSNSMCAFSKLILLFFLCIHLTISQTTGDRLASEEKCDLNKLPKNNLVCFFRAEEYVRQTDLDPCLCTHLIYSSIIVKDNFAFVAGRKGDLKQLAAFKERNSLLKVLVSIKWKIDWLNSTDANDWLFDKNKFAKRTRDFLIRHNLDGLDINWSQFYAHEIDNPSINNRKDILLNFVKTFDFVFKQLVNDAFYINNDENNSKERNLIISITTSNRVQDLISNYGFSNIQSYINFVNLPAFDFPLLEDPQDTDIGHFQHPSQLHALTGAQNVDTLVDLLITLGLPANKLNIGIPTYGVYKEIKHFEKITNNLIESSPELKVNRSTICELRNQLNWTLTREADGSAPALIRGNNEWIGFDDELSVRLKARYSKLRGLAGVALWYLNDDDPAGKCQAEGSFAITRSIVIGLNGENLILDKTNSDLSFVPFWKADGEGDFIDILERYGNVERIVEQEEGEAEILPCDKAGYRMHPKDCTGFYRCVKINSNNQQANNLDLSTTLLRFKYKCGSGLVFDESLAMCNYPSWSNKCSNSGEVEQTTSLNLCTVPNSYYQMPKNCEYFVYCNQKLRAFQFKCPFELGFDQQNLQCNWKWLVAGCNVATSNNVFKNNISSLFNSNLINKNNENHQSSSSSASSSTNDLTNSIQSNNFFDASIPENSLSLDIKNFESKRTFADQESLELNKMASKIHTIRQKRAVSVLETNSDLSFTKSIKNKVEGLFGSVKHFLNDKNQEIIESKDHEKSVKRQDSIFGDWFQHMPFMFSAPSQIVQTYHLPISNNKGKLHYDTYVKPFNDHSSKKQNLLNLNTASTIQNLVNSHVMHNKQPLVNKINNAIYLKNNPLPIHNENHLIPIITIHKNPINIPTNINKNKPAPNQVNANIKENIQNIQNFKNLNNNQDTHNPNNKFKKQATNLKEKRIQRRPDLQISELVKQELNKFRLNTKPQNLNYNLNTNLNSKNNHNQNEHRPKEFKDDLIKDKKIILSNVNPYTSNSNLDMDLVRYPLHNQDIIHSKNHFKTNHLYSQFPKNNLHILEHTHHIDEHVHIPFIPKSSLPANYKKNNGNKLDTFSPSDLIQDFKNDHRHAHFYSNERVQNKKSNIKKSSNVLKNGFVPIKKNKQLLVSSASQLNYHNKTQKHQVNSPSNTSRNRLDKKKNIQKNANLLIIPVPDNHPKAQSLEEIQKLINYYPEFFPQDFNLESRIKKLNASVDTIIKDNLHADYFVVTIDEMNKNQTINRPVIKLEEYLKYDLSQDKFKNSNKPKKITPYIKPNQNWYTSNSFTNFNKPSSARKSSQNKPFTTVKPKLTSKLSIPEIPLNPTFTTSTSKAPVIIKLEIPHGKPEIVERIFDKVKDDLIHTTSSLSPDRPVYISVTTPIQNIPSNDKQQIQTTASTIYAPLKTDSTSTTPTYPSSKNTKDYGYGSNTENEELIDSSKIYLLGEQQIPQHVFESLKQVINDRVTEHIVTTTTDKSWPDLEPVSKKYIYSNASQDKFTTTAYKSSNQNKKHRTTTNRPNYSQANLKKNENNKNIEHDFDANMPKPIWKQNWPPNISYLSLLKNRNNANSTSSKVYDLNVDPLVNLQSVTKTTKNKKHNLHSNQDSPIVTFTISSYIAESTTPVYIENLNTKKQKGLIKEDLNKKKNQQNVDVYLVSDTNRISEAKSNLQAIDEAASGQHAKHVDHFETYNQDLKIKALDQSQNNDNLNLEDAKTFENNFLKIVNLQETYNSENVTFKIAFETLNESFQNLPTSIQQYQKARNNLNLADLMPETTCLREGLFQHPQDCNKFYECIYDSSLSKYVAHSFECTIKVAFDNRIIGCSSPTDLTVCIQY